MTTAAAARTMRLGRHRTGRTSVRCWCGTALGLFPPADYDGMLAAYEAHLGEAHGDT